MRVPPFLDYLGIRPTRWRKGHVELELDLQPHHCNLKEVAHGGVLVALLDSALGGAVVSAIPREWWCSTTSLQTQFLEVARRGRLTARGELVRRGRYVAFAAGEVVDGDGNLLATASGTWQLWPYRPGRPEAEPQPYVVERTSGERLRVGKILAVGRNYAEHAKEMGAEPSRAPVIFLKPPSALVHDGASIRLPRGLGEVHHEVELVALIGLRGRAIPEERALDHVLGIAVGLDLTLRELQAEAKRRGEPWSLSKGFDGAAPISPFVPLEQVGDGSGLRIALEINGEIRQEGSTSRMQRSLAQLVAQTSEWITLERGDLLFTGTPEGVGPVRPGDHLRAELERVGTLEVRIAAEAD